MNESQKAVEYSRAQHQYICRLESAVRLLVGADVKQSEGLRIAAEVNAECLLEENAKYHQNYIEWANAQ